MAVVESGGVFEWWCVSEGGTQICRGLNVGRKRRERSKERNLPTSANPPSKPPQMPQHHHPSFLQRQDRPGTSGRPNRRWEVHFEPRTVGVGQEGWETESAVEEGKDGEQRAVGWSVLM
jgi:hypothetical protein